jgi:hypothetical protein
VKRRLPSTVDALPSTSSTQEFITSFGFFWFFATQKVKHAFQASRTG